MSSDNGQTYGAAFQLSNNLAGKHTFQRAYASGSDIYVTWEQTLSGGTQNILFRASTNGGTRWGTLLTLNSVLIPSTCPFLCAQPTLTATGTDVYVTWTQQNPYQLSLGSGEDAFIRASTNNGASFGAEHYFGNSQYTGGSHEPEVAASGSNVYIVWDGARLWFQVSHDNGATWFFSNTYAANESAMDLSQNPAWSLNGFAINREPHVAASGSNVYVIWESDYGTSVKNGPEKTYLQESTDSGNTWLTNSSGGLSPFVFGLHTWLPIVYPSGSNVYAAWGQIVNGNFQAYFAESSNAGTTWSGAINLSNDAGSSHDTQLAALGSVVYVMYFDTTTSFGGSGLHPVVRESTDGGTTFGTAVDLSQGAGQTTEVQNDQPQIVISGSNVCAVWLQKVGSIQTIQYAYASSP
ncbi:MAG: sialidase family protein [Nitrososphaerales archaeon]